MKRNFSEITKSD